MAYPRHPSEVLRDIRGDRSANLMGQQMDARVGWPESRWSNLEKESQDFHDEYIMDLVEVGLLREGDEEHKELEDWLEMQEQIADAASHTKYELRKAMEEADGPEDFENMLEKLDGPKGPGKAKQEYKEVPPKHVPGLKELLEDNEREARARHETPDDVDEEEPPRQTEQERDNSKKTLAGAPWAKIVSILLMAGIGVLLIYGVSWAVRNVQIGKNTPATPIPAVTVQEKVVQVVVTATPKPDSSAEEREVSPVAPAEEMESGTISIDMWDQLPPEYRERVFSNASAIWVREGVQLLCKPNPYEDREWSYGPGKHHLLASDPASDMVGWVQIDCPEGLPDNEVVIRLWENNPQEDDRFGYGWEWRVFADGSYQFVEP